MNVNMVCQGAEEMYPDAYFVTRENLYAHGSPDDRGETIKGLRGIVMLSMQWLEIMLSHGHFRRTFDRDSLLQDSDPYVEGLLNMIRKEKTNQG